MDRMPWRIDRKLELRAKFFGLIDQCNDSPIFNIGGDDFGTGIGVRHGQRWCTLLHWARLLALDNLAEKPRFIDPLAQPDELHLDIVLGCSSAFLHFVFGIYLLG
jgi:hypothetical protein